jgi:FtsP/CotA-like multicopper oxidase with cupredoxin domain
MQKETYMQKATRRILVSGNEPHGIGKIEAKSVKRALTPVSRWYFLSRPVGVIAAIAVAVGITVVALSNFVRVTGAHPVNPLESSTQLGSPPFANPSEIKYRAGEKRLRGVMQLISGKYSIPNVGTETLRQFRGWDAAQPTPDFIKDVISPGPTLRARLGDQVQIAFLNKIDDRQFPYTFVTDNKGSPDFGCDKSGTREPPPPKGTGFVNPYPWSDTYPNCFHGSSTANIHFHGTHTEPDGLGDNVLLQLLPQVSQPDWTATFNKIFAGKIPKKWADMPAIYQQMQLKMIKQQGQGLYDADMKAITAGQWPQYLMGAFPNFFQIPDYDAPGQPFNSGNNGYKMGQAPGTHWYHAHKHGSTSLHILNGLAGAFVIESSRAGGYDHVIRAFYRWGDAYDDHEKIIVFQQFDTTQNLERTKNTTTGGAPLNQGKGIKQVLVNGKLTPTITMRPGDVQLWRLVNATEGNNAGKLTLKFGAVANLEFKQTAQDGVQFSPTNYQNQPFLNGLLLAGGNRADFLVNALKPTTEPIAIKNGNTILFYVNVTGTPVKLPNGPFPVESTTPPIQHQWAQMPRFLLDLPAPGSNDIKNPNSPVKFQWEAGRTGTGLNPFPYPTPSPSASPSPTPYPNLYPPHFMINDKQFSEKVVDQCMPLNALQDWVLENYSTPLHPFHIHINPFQVIKIETPSGTPPDITYNTYAPPNNFVWQDVIALPSAKISADGKQIWPSKVTIRSSFVDFMGTYVLHCHILAHEDRGMMQMVRVVPAADYPARCQANLPSHH